MFSTSYWEPKNLAFIGYWYDKFSKADILAHLKTVRAKYVCATLIHQQNNRASLKAAGFKPVAYGGRNGSIGSIHLWLAENPFYPKEIEGPDSTHESLNTFSCGVYQKYTAYKPPKNRVWVGQEKLPGARVLCPGWYVVGKKGHSVLYL